MPFQPAPGAASVRVEQQLAGNELNYILNFSRPGVEPYGASELTDLANLVYDWWVDRIGPELSSQVTLRSVTARALDGPFGPQVTYNPGTPAGGAITQEAAPANVAFCVTHRSNLIGRSWRGRTYVAGFPRGDVALNQLAGAKVVAFVSAFNNLRTRASELGDTFVVLSRQFNKVVRPEAQWTPIRLSEANDSRVDSQRGRLD